MKPEHDDENLPEQIEFEDVDDVIGVALELRDESESKISTDTLEDIAEELDIDPRYVDRALDVLDERRAEAKRMDERSQLLRIQSYKLALKVLLGCLLVSGVGIVSWTLLTANTQSALASEWAEVEQRRSQVLNVQQRMHLVQQRLAEAPRNIQTNDELAGAENRVSIERRRYDRAAAQYNQLTSSLPHAWFCSYVEAPCHAALAHEVFE